MSQSGWTHRDQSGTTREAVEFAAAAYGFSWAPHLVLVATRRPYARTRGLPAALYASGLLGPSAAAFVMAGRPAGRGSQGRLASAGSVGRVTVPRAIAAICAEPLMMLASARLDGQPVKLTRPDPLDGIRQLWVVIGEEFGWRGFLLPRLRQQLPPWAAIPVMTAVWGGWHLPMFFVRGSPQSKDSPAEFAAAIFAWSALHHLFQIGRPSVATAMLFHAAANQSGNVLDIGAGTRRLAVVYVVVGVAATVTATFLDRRAGRGTT